MRRRKLNRKKPCSCGCGQRINLDEFFSPKCGRGRKSKNSISCKDHLILFGKITLEKEIKNNDKKYCKACRRINWGNYKGFCPACYVWLYNNKLLNNTLDDQIKFRQEFLKTNNRYKNKIEKIYRCYSCPTSVHPRKFCLNCKNWLIRNGYWKLPLKEKIEIRRKFLDQHQHELSFKYDFDQSDFDLCICSKCKEKKPVRDFYSYKDGSPSPICLSCLRKHAKKLERIRREREKKEEKQIENFYVNVDVGTLLNL